MTHRAYYRQPDVTHPIDYDAVLTIVQMARAGTLTPAETRMRLRQVIG